MEKTASLVLCPVTILRAASRYTAPVVFFITLHFAGAAGYVSFSSSKASTRQSFSDSSTSSCGSPGARARNQPAKSTILAKASASRPGYLAQIAAKLDKRMRRISDTSHTTSYGFSALAAQLTHKAKFKIPDGGTLGCLFRNSRILVVTRHCMLWISSSFFSCCSSVVSINDWLPLFMKSCRAFFQAWLYADLKGNWKRFTLLMARSLSYEMSALDRFGGKSLSIS
ncbi:hypothetical protein RvY_14239 [Ramazzottius varieornatus]|uniref:Uncharacterized protein n=1 Tax=Ramazzottius varieornatus TaxID=947166 RepID=A0A1D1VQN8_RAMVA|nr:hypothetical protein RvY_14239 [Ramazzottius varieornatus]